MALRKSSWPSPMQSGTTVQKAFDHIRDRIIAGEYSPGAVLSEAALAKQIGVSRTPVGEALRELAGIGLVEQVPRYGTIVRAITRQEVVELYELREGLEPHAVALAAERINPANVERLKRLCQRIEGFLAELPATAKSARLEGQTLREFLAADMAFHTILIHAAGNRRIAKVVRDSHVMTELFGTRRLVHDRPIVAEVCRFHSEILAAVEEGDAARARHVAAEHIRTSLTHTLDCLDEHRSAGDLGAVALPEDVREELGRIESSLGQPKRKGKR